MDEFDKEEVNFDFEEFSLKELDSLDGNGGWTSEPYDNLNFEIDPTWLD
tara:strand:- start:2740 stop:2886 length:147 start_codon:yes stop_codon:yes gene_type:complete